MKSKKKLIIIPAVIVIAAVFAYEYFTNRPHSDPSAIRLSGNIEITDTEVSFKIPGRVEERLVSEGMMVEAGQTVARLDSSELIKEVDLRKAELEAAQAALAELEAGSRPEEVAMAEATATRLRTDVAHAKRDLERIEELHSKGVVPVESLDDAKTNYEAATARLREAEQHLKLVKEGPRKETIEQARARAAQAQASLALAETRFSYAVVVSPLTGVVMSENIEAGEYVAPGTPVVTIGDLVNVWVRGYINETDLGRVKVGQPVHVTIDTYPGKVYEGRISFIASQAEFTPKNVQTEKERVKLVYRVKVDITNPNMELKPGMPADAEILLGERSAK